MTDSTVWDDIERVKANQENSVWDDIHDELDRYGVDSYSKTTTYTAPTQRTPAKKKEPPQPPKDDQGNVLTAEEIKEALSNVKQAAFRIDAEVRGIRDPEKQALAVKDHIWEYKSRIRKLEDWLDDAKRYERHRLLELGIRPFGMPGDEGNRAITEIVDEQTEWFHDELDGLKDQLAERIRAKLDSLEEPAPVKTRDAIYDALVDAEVIESWEPLEF